MAEFRAAAVFSDHMVLQRNKNIQIFGKGNEAAEVKVRLFHTQTASNRTQTEGGEHSGDGWEKDSTAVTTVREGRWSAELPAHQAGEDYQMEISCGDSCIRFTDIAIGEVWIAGGQSNMEFELQNCQEGPEALQHDQNPGVRFYYTQKNAYMDEHFFETERNTCWQCFGDEYTGSWSAVGYFFARKLAKELGVTVGVIGCNWGGTSASCWMDRESLLEDAELRSYVDEYEEAVKGISEAEQVKAYDEYEAYHALWGKKAEQCAIEDPKMAWDEILRRCGECKWPGPMNCKNPFRPSGLYECMLKRIMPYTVKGVIWYQGESDDHKPRMYEKLFTKMIRVWRRDWKDMTLPFLFVQLPMHRYQQDPDFKNWPLIREAQMNVYQSIRHTGMAVITEFSEFHEIHPRCKKPVGERLELQAMHEVYHRIPAEEANGPLYRTYRIMPDGVTEDGQQKERIRLFFDYAEQGFEVRTLAEQTTRDGGTAGFEIAGADRCFAEADIEVQKSHIDVWSESVPKPRYVRYCWTNYCTVPVFGAANGIPLAPFRTDCDDELQENVGKAEVQQVMEL